MIGEINRPAIFYDFYYLWAAGRVAEQGGNIYDPVSLAQQMYLVGWPQQELVYGMLYPPWTMWLFLPIGALSFTMAKMVWGCLIAAAYLLCIRLCFRLQDGKQLSLNLLSPSRLVLASFAFPPFIKLAVFGQSVFVALLGLMLFCYYFQRKQYFKAGVAISFTLIKPQLLLPVFAALTVSSLRTRNLRLLFGGFVGFFVQAAVSVYLYPQGASLYIDLLMRKSMSIASLRAPTLGQMAVFFLQIGWVSPLLLMVGLTVGITCGASKRFSIYTLIYMLFPLSLIAAPYAWSHDFVLLIAPYLLFVNDLFARLKQRAFYVLFFFALCGYLIIAYIRSEFLMVVLPFTLLIYGWHSLKKSQAYMKSLCL